MVLRALANDRQQVRGTGATLISTSPQLASQSRSLAHVALASKGYHRRYPFASMLLLRRHESAQVENPPPGLNVPTSAARPSRHFSHVRPQIKTAFYNSCLYNLTLVARLKSSHLVECSLFSPLSFFSSRRAQSWRRDALTAASFYEATSSSYTNLDGSLRLTDKPGKRSRSLPNPCRTSPFSSHLRSVSHTLVQIPEPGDRGTSTSCIFEFVLIATPALLPSHGP